MEEIENKIQSHHKIKKAVVVTREKKGNKFLCAYYVAANETVSTLELKQFLVQCLPDYMIPVYFVPMETIPMTPNGKVERRHLPEPGFELLDDYIKPDTPMEKIIAEIWKQVLGIDKIGVHTRFFDLGGNSVNILKVHSKLKETIKADFPLMVIFKYPTIYSLAGYLSSAGRGGDDIEATQTHQLDLEKTMMNQTPTPLTPANNNEFPLRTAVNSFGMGGTNAHVILEEAPPVSQSINQWVSESVRKAPGGTRRLAPLSNRQYQLILLSAKTESTLGKAAENPEFSLKNTP